MTPQQTTDLSQVLAATGLTPHADAFQPGWAESQACRPAAPLPFLAPDCLRACCARADLSADITEDVLATAAAIRLDPALEALAWYCHDRLFRARDPQVRVANWPVPAAALAAQAGLFYAVVLLSGTPEREALHRRLGIPESVVRESVSDLEVCIRTEPVRELGGRFGISGGILGWLLLTWRGQLYRLGRLQFLPDRFHGRLRAYRHHRTRAVVALAEAGCRFRADGQFDGAGQISDPDHAWTATVADSARQVLGYPISPWGVAVRRRICLRKSEWSQVLAPGDPILGTHMAAGGPLTPEACGDSIRRALDFFPRYFPERPFLGFDCVSWLLDPQFPHLLPATSNLVRFQQELYVFPYPGGSGGIPWQVQPGNGGAGAEPPPRTSMQRAFQAHAAAGGRFLTGGGFLLTEDVRWGTQVYRRQALPWRWLNAGATLTTRPA